ncbi:hypothetical protein [Saccharopolyspora sp. 5N708]|uniref:hypothetical protein n=1 Tax=Saccharopolyspora sp. 5N708 TaxID=3457424 RepID=UPI003FD21F40
MPSTTTRRAVSASTQRVPVVAAQRGVTNNDNGAPFVKDATAGPRHPDWGDGYEAAIINYRFLAHSVPSTKQIVDDVLQ